MAIYGYVWLCRAMYGYVWLCMDMYGYVRLCRAIYGYVWLCRAVTRVIFQRTGSLQTKLNAGLSEQQQED